MIRSNRALSAFLAGTVLIAGCGSKAQPQPISPAPAATPSETGMTIDLRFGTGTTMTFHLEAPPEVTSFDGCLRLSAGIDLPFTVPAKAGGSLVRFLNVPLGSHRLYVAAKDRDGQTVNEQNHWSGYALVGLLNASEAQASINAGTFSIQLKGEDIPEPAIDPVEATLTHEYSAVLNLDSTSALPLGRVSFARSPWDGGYALTATLRNASGIPLKTVKLYFDSANALRAVGKPGEPNLAWIDATASAALQSPSVEWDERGIVTAAIPYSLIPDDILGDVEVPDALKARLPNSMIHLARINRDPLKGGG